ncbi:FMRFamide receptor [Aphelenchoides bicaudatus]|nr:FMRFamide receptor [Aphelenchoides bicaudatus]
MDVQHLLASATLFIISIGILGNLLSLTLFLRHSSSVNVLLSALAFVDLCLLLFAIPVFVVPNLDIWTEDDTAGGITQPTYLAYILKFVYPVNLIFQTCSIYVMVLITAERYIAVSKPLQVHIYCTARTSRRALLIIASLATIYNAPRFFEYSISYSSGATYYERNLRDNPTYVIGYFTIAYLITHFVFPFGLILVLNCYVIRKILQLRKERLSLTRQQIREQSTTLMLLIVTFVFAGCNTLPFLLNLAECVKPDLFSDENTSTIAFQLNDLSTLLVVLNSSTTFIIYLIFSAKYRHTAAKILSRICLFGKENLHYNSLGRTYSMRASMSLNRKSNMNSLMDNKMPKRTDRSHSEFNERIQRPASAMLPKLSKRQSVRSVVSYRSTKSAHTSEKAQTPTNNGLLSPPPTNSTPTMQWSTTSMDRSDRPLLNNN